YLGNGGLWFHSYSESLCKSGDQDQKQEHSGLKADLSVKSQGKSCRSWLAGDAGPSGYQVHPVDAIAGKPAPTVGRVRQ
ncbi:hypothetical protein QN410_27885, partial [Pseudomonas sp. Bout1]|nr:hypothetical protein [Pseudomonas sp. Bout1]